VYDIASGASPICSGRKNSGDDQSAIQTPE
jgi:hypothetical protein